jgi:hypothetical protein
LLSSLLLLPLLLVGCGPSSGRCRTERALLVDDFNDTACGWDQYDEEEASAGYATGAYLVTVHQSNTSAVAVPGGQFSDVSVQVETRLERGSVNNNFGLVCRYQDMDQLYAFLISSDGYYAIVRVGGGASYRILSGDGRHLMPSDAIQTKEGAVNEIRALCAADELTLYVNGRQLASVSDDLLVSGDIGFIVSTYEEAPTTVRFDNLFVQESAVPYDQSE